jgi:hypothetical protein
MKRISATRTPLRRVPGQHGFRLFRLALIAVAGATVLFAAPAGHAAAPGKYTVQPLLKRGDKVPGTSIPAQYGFEVSALNDNGQLLFVAYPPNTDALFQYSGGKFSPIAGPGIPAPTASGHWPAGNVFSPASMNQNGDAVFAMQDSNGNWIGTFRWDATAGKSTAVALNGTPAVNGLTFTQAGFPRPAINQSGAIAFPALVKNAAGKVLDISLFFQGQDGKTQALVLPGQAGPDGATLDNALMATITDDGRIGFIARRHGQLRPSAYLSEGGQLTPVAIVGTGAPGGGKITEVLHAWANNKNHDLLVEVVLNDLDTGPHALYRWSNGSLIPVVVPGQAMPGGGQFVSLMYESVSFPNEAGQHAFYGLVTEGGITRTAAYLLGTDGTLSLILKTGDTTELGTLARVGDPDEDDGGAFGIALNSKGQVAVVLKPVNGRQTLSLLTPAAP